MVVLMTGRRDWITREKDKREEGRAVVVFVVSKVLICPLSNG